MANNNLEAYLEAIQAAVEGGDIPPVPTPSWNHEQYLAAILAALVSGGGSSDEPLIGERTFTQVLGDPTSEGSGMMRTYYYELDDGIEDYLEYSEDEQTYFPKQNCSYTIGGSTPDGGFFVKKDGKLYYVDFTTIIGDRTFVMTETTFSPALINLYDPNSEDTTNYLSDGVEYDDGYVVSFDVSAAYERLKRGLPVWVRVFDPDTGDAGIVSIGLVLNYILTDADELQLAFSMNNYTAFVYCDNYTGTSDDSGAENDQPPISPISPNSPI